MWPRPRFHVASALRLFRALWCGVFVCCFRRLYAIWIIDILFGNWERFNALINAHLQSSGLVPSVWSLPKMLLLSCHSRLFYSVERLCESLLVTLYGFCSRAYGNLWFSFGYGCKWMSAFQTCLCGCKWSSPVARVYLGSRGVLARILFTR